jgi:hypothetical protein
VKNKLYIILALFTIYIITYVLIGKNSLGLEIIENNNFIKKQDSIQIQIYNLEDYKRNQRNIKTILQEKGFKTVTVNYAENFLNENKYSYWLEIQELVPLVAFAYDGHFKKDEISEEFESLNVWCFYKWIPVYHKRKN